MKKNKKKIDHWKKSAFFLDFFFNHWKTKLPLVFCFVFPFQNWKKGWKECLRVSFEVFFEEKKNFVFFFTFLSSNELTIRNLFLFGSINKIGSFFPFTTLSSSTSTYNLFFQIKQFNHQKNNKYTFFFLFPFLFCSISSTFTILIQPKNKQIKRETTRTKLNFLSNTFYSITPTIPTKFQFFTSNLISTK